MIEQAKGYHHGFLGIAMMLSGFLGILFTALPLWLCWTVIGIGLVVFLDDVVQHSIQRSRPEYRSWLNRLYGRTLYRIPAVRMVNEWVDGLLGRKTR
jgi:hypothetical protein